MASEPQTYSGEVEFPFSFPFEAPEGGCIVRFTFTVVQDRDAASYFGAPSAAFSVSSDKDSEPIYSEIATSQSGEIDIADAGLCVVKWEHSSVLSSMSTLGSITYEVVVIPRTHLLLGARRTLVVLAQRGAVEELLCALAALPVDAADDSGRTALHGAAAGGWPQLVALLLDRGAPLESRSADGLTPLLEACAVGQSVSVLSALLDAGAEHGAAALDDSGCNALHHLASSGPSTDLGRTAAEALHVLSSRTAAAEMRQMLGQLSADGDTPLVCASRSGLVRVAEALLDLGASVGECDGKALLAAARSGRLGCAELLLAHGADAAHMHDSIGSPLHAAAGAGHRQLVELLLPKALGSGGPSVPWLGEPTQPSAEGTPSTSILLRTDGEWRSPLLCAAAAGFGECVQLLVEAGSPLEQTDREGNTPLLSACASGDPVAVSVLLAAGASPTHRNNAEQDALCCAAVGGYLPVLPLLLPACVERLPYAMVQAAAAGQARTAIALVELCPMPPPLTSSSTDGVVSGAKGAPPSLSTSTSAGSAVGAEVACVQLVRALWQRCLEEKDPAAWELCAAEPEPTRLSAPPPRLVDNGAGAIAPDAIASGAIGAAVVGAASIGAMVSEGRESSAYASTPVAGGGSEVEVGLSTMSEADEDEDADGLGDDLLSIQEAIREVLDSDEDDP